MQFSFDVKEMNTGIIVVEAETYEEAIAKAHKEYHEGETIWVRTKLSVD